jgi:hypothetical protein
MCEPHNVPGGVCCTFDVLYCCPEMTRVYKPLVSAPMQSNNFLDTDKKSQLYMGSLDSNDSHRPFHNSGEWAK